MFFPADYPKRGELLPRALAEHVMAQVEDPASLGRWDNPAYQLITLILIRCGLRSPTPPRLPFDCLACDADGAPYLRYYNRKMKREALVPIDEELAAPHRPASSTGPRNAGPPAPRCCSPGRNPTSTAPALTGGTYRAPSTAGWACDIRDEHGQPVHLTPHQWRHTLGTPLINRDVPQHVVQKILDHDSAPDDRPLRPAVGQDRPPSTGRKPARSTPPASPSSSAPAGRSATPPGPSTGSRAPPRRCRTATASCRW